jgi:REP element-mobilizing transposase RayT
MARRRRVFAPGVLYHVIVQGNQREKTFTSDGDYQAYLERLAKYRRQSTSSCAVYAFCLYLLELIRYIHLNPVPAGMVRASEQY